MCSDEASTEDEEDLPFKVEEVPEKGVCVVAIRDIEPLEVILNDQAAVVGPNHYSPPVCLGCLKVTDGKQVCHTCSFPMCSETCRESSSHNKECNLLIGVDENNLKIIAVLRLLLLRESDSDNWKNIDTLRDHDVDRRQDVCEWNMFQHDVVDVIKSRIKVKDELIHHLIGILSINSVTINFREERIYGRALYPLLSLVNHSCTSNARYTVNPKDFSVVLRARRKILEGEEITISYIPPFIGQPRRRMEISNEWYFTCRCPRCVDPTEFGTFVSALKCNSCNEGLVLPHSSEEGSVWRCRFCSNPYEEEMVVESIEKLEEQLEKISNSGPAIEKYEEFIKGNSKILAMKHYLILSAQRNIVELLVEKKTRRREDCKKLMRLSKSYLGTMSRLDPGYTRWRGDMLSRYNMAQLEMLKMDLDENIIDRNQFAKKSEEVWSSMAEVNYCDTLCMPPTNPNK